MCVCVYDKNKDAVGSSSAVNIYDGDINDRSNINICH